MTYHVRQGDDKDHVDTHGSEDLRLRRAAFRLTEQGQEKQEVILRSRQGVKAPSLSNAHARSVLLKSGDLLVGCMSKPAPD